MYQTDTFLNSLEKLREKEQEIEKDIMLGVSRTAITLNDHPMSDQLLH